MKISNKLFVALGGFILILLTFNSVFAQIENYFVPAKWELYSVKEEKVSFLMPRLPVLIEDSKACEGEKNKDYVAYNNGLVYSVNIISKDELPKWCSNSKRKFFDDNKFIERLNQLKKDLKIESGSESNIKNDSIIILKGKNKIIKLVNDYDNQRWFEVTIYGLGENKKKVENFLSSFKFENKISGISIGQGADQIYGDDASDSVIEKEVVREGVTEKVKQLIIKTDSNITGGVTIITKPRPRYTDAARKNNVEGTVILRVTFMANGSISSITPVSVLPFGLTEQAIIAAKKMVFLPAQREGSRYSVTKQVAFKFTIY